MNETKKARSSNIEMLRVVAMFMIVLFHITTHCIVPQLNNAGTPMVSYFTQPIFHKRLLLLDWLNTLGIISNAIFILISGYFMANHESTNIKLGRIAQKLLLQLGFASLLLVCIPPLIHLMNPGFPMNMQGIGIFNGMSWFAGYYFLVVTCGALFFNNFLHQLDREKYAAFLLTLFAFIQFSWSRGRVEALAAGLGTVLTGLLLYALGGFIKRFEPFQTIKSAAFVSIIVLINGLVLLSGYNLTENKILSFLRQGGDKLPVPIILFYDNFTIAFMIYLLHDNDFFYSLWHHRNWIATLADGFAVFTLHLLKWASFTFLLGVIAYGMYGLSAKLYRRCQHLFRKELMENEAALPAVRRDTPTPHTRNSATPPPAPGASAPSYPYPTESPARWARRPRCQDRPSGYSRRTPARSNYPPCTAPRHHLSA